MAGFLGLLRGDLRLALRQDGDMRAWCWRFFVLAVVLFPFGVGPEPELLARSRRRHSLGRGPARRAVIAGPAVRDPITQDGGLDLIALSPMPLELAVLAKCAAHWLTTGLPLAMVSPVLALFVDLDHVRIPTLIAEPADRDPGA